MQLDNQSNPISFLPSLRGYVEKALEIQALNVELIKDGRVHKALLYEMRKSSIEYLEATYSYQLQLRAWRNSITASNYKNAIDTLEADLSELRELSKFVLQETTSLCNSIMS